MKIREQACDSNIVLSKFKFNCDECDKSIPDPLSRRKGRMSIRHLVLIRHFMVV